MKCPRCTKENSADAKFCMHCGYQFASEEGQPQEGEGSPGAYQPGGDQPPYGGQPPQGGAYQPGGFYQTGGQYRPGQSGDPYMRQPDYTHVPSWLIANIVLTVLSLFTCSCISLIFGAIGIGFAAQVSSHARNGDIDNARRASSTAKTMFWIGLIVGLLTVIAWIGTFLAGWETIPYEYFEEMLPPEYRNWNSASVFAARLLG